MRRWCACKHVRMAPWDDAGDLHHLELWRDDATATQGAWSWLLSRLGYTCTETWATGRRWDLAESYLVLESGPNHVRGATDRRGSGMNHLALWGGSRAEVDVVTAEAPQHGWRLLFADRHPHARGP